MIRTPRFDDTLIISRYFFINNIIATELQKLFVILQLKRSRRKDQEGKIKKDKKIKRKDI